MEHSDKQLLRRLRLGQGEALREVYVRYKDPMLALALTLIQDKSSAEDIVHDVFVGFARVARELRLRSSLKAYLCTAVVNRVRSYHRAGQREGSESVETVELGDAEDPSETVSLSEQLVCLDRAVAQLPQEQREVIVLRLQSRLKFREIARSQRISLNTALTRYRYGVARLRTLLKGKVKP